ncbi:MAG TPA: 2,3,4,5-tetrahydropyridine-2,6-dicarboxylate N-succinyltransferase, partial [Methylophilaceae bacterium]|nr:2,3,4,5-tetrahydropyridine-2,6-dicarboxylate N-succinyltransferase [Methylophilaceae bacterium]
MQELQSIIETAFENRANINPANADNTIKDAVFGTLEELNAGRLRVASRKPGTQEWE